METARFISEEISPFFEVAPVFAKKPGCPNGFAWRGQVFRVAALLAEWSDFDRRGRFGRNMQPHNLRKAVRRGSFGVGRFYFRVRTVDGRVFDIYYDRAPKNAAVKDGFWQLYREWKP